MSARIKGATESALLRLSFEATYMFRPAYIQPLHGIRSRTKRTRVLYAVIGPFYPVLKALLPRHVTTTEKLARSMIHVAKHVPRAILGSARDALPDINVVFLREPPKRTIATS